MRPRLNKVYSTTSLKLERDVVESFKIMLNGKSKNSYIIEKIVYLKDFFQTATDEDKVKFMVEMLPYATRRKHMGEEADENKRKEYVVSVKCEKDDYEYVVEKSTQLGLTFSEIMRRLILKDIANGVKYEKKTKGK